MVRKSWLVPALASLALVACDKSGSEPPGTAAAGLSGTVLERIDAPPYSYLRLDAQGGEIWAAVPQTALADGARVTIVDPQPMDGFESKQLHRKFDRIVFGNLAGTPTSPAARFPREMMQAIAAGEAANPHAAPAAAGDLAQAHAGVAAGPADAPAAKVEKAGGPNAKTVAEVWAGKADLAGQEVRVRGTVVKYNGGILGKNWIHLRDGSGSREAKDDDLTVTTSATAAVGETITVTGKVAVDRDFGAGYRYPVIVEDARVEK